MSLSYTEMSHLLTPRRNIGLAGGVDLSSAESAEAWMSTLPPSVRSGLQNKLKQIALALPAPAQIALANSIVASGHSLPFGMPLDGLGCPCTEGADGLGQWDALLTGLVKAGTDLYASKINTDLQKNLAKKSAATDLAIAKAQLAAQNAVALAQVQADAQAKAAKAPMIKSAIMWGGISLTLAVGIGAIVYLRKKKK